MTRLVRTYDRQALGGVVITWERDSRGVAVRCMADGWPVRHYEDEDAGLTTRYLVDLHEVQDMLAAHQPGGPVPAGQCGACGHAHYRGRRCGGDIGHPLGILCWCGRGRGTPMARRGRPAIPAQVRAAVIARDGWVCTLCRRRLVARSRSSRTRGRTLHLDHIVPVSHGGPDTVDNLRVLCAACNISRGNRPWVDDELAARAARRRGLELTR